MFLLYTLAGQLLEIAAFFIRGVRDSNRIAKRYYNDAKKSFLIEVRHKKDKAQ